MIVQESFLRSLNKNYGKHTVYIHRQMVDPGIMKHVSRYDQNIDCILHMKRVLYMERA
jgi:hypothetical protein